MVPRNNIYTECFRVPDRGLKISTNEEETTKERLGAIPSEKWDQLVQSLQGRDELDKLEEQTRTVIGKLSSPAVARGSGGASLPTHTESSLTFVCLLS